MTTANVQHNCTREFFSSFVSKHKCKDAIIMDSGCGDGYASRTFVTYGALLVLAYDPVLNLNQEFTHPRIKHYDSLKVMHNICDIVWSHHVIEHVDNPIEYLRQLKGRLDKNGELWLTCPNTSTTRNCVYSGGHINNFNIANMIQCLERAGYPAHLTRWWLTDGQLRIRVPKYSMDTSKYPQPFMRALSMNNHFNVSELPQKWRWKNEE